MKSFDQITKVANEIDWNLIVITITSGLVFMAKASYLLGVLTRHAYERLKSYVCSTLELSSERLQACEWPQEWLWAAPLLVTMGQSLRPLREALRYLWDALETNQNTNTQAKMHTPWSLDELASLTVKELRILAAEVGVKNSHKYTKNLLIQQICFTIG